MANEIYHRSNWGNAVNDKYWADVYEKYSATNKMFIRSDYYENSNVTDKLMADIYPKPSILLTPTAYDNGSLHSVKPVKTFGSELVTNGDFSNGSTGWTSYGTVNISNGIATIGASSNSGIFQNILTQNKSYKVTLDVLSYDGVGNIQVIDETGFVLYSITETGVQTFNFKHTASSGLFIIRGTVNALFSIDNVSVKEVTEADFDFTRGSSATRVNEKGLIEDVQILSGNLVQNGDFSQEGSQLITNGSFDTNSDWSNFSTPTTSEQSTDKAYLGSYSWYVVATAFRQGIFSPNNFSLVNGKTYKASLWIYAVDGAEILSGVTNSDATVFTSRAVTQGQWTNVVYYFTANASSASYISILSSSSTLEFYVDNVSVKQVDPNDYWTLGTGWSFGDNKAIFNGGTDANLSSSVNVVNGKSYKYNFTISDMNTGSLSFRLGSSSTNDLRVTSNGYYSGQAISDGTSILFRAESGFNGSITNISVIEITDDTNLPRINYTNFDYENGVVVPYSGEGSLKLENQSTNLITYSEDFSDSYWRKDKITVTSNSIISPTGEINASLIQETSYTSSIPSIDINSPSSLGAGTYTFSFYVKNNNGRYLGISFGSSGERVRTNFDFNTNTFKVLNLSGSTTGTASFTTLGDFYRISITATFPSATIADTVLMPLATDTYPFFAFQNSDNRSFYLWGAMVEQQSYATSYIPTSGSTVTRLADVCNNAGSSDLINSTEGVLYAEISALADGTNQRWISVGSGSNANRVSILYKATNRISCSVRGSSSAIYDADFNIGSQTNNSKVAIRYKNSDFAFFVNGVKVNSQTSGTLNFNSVLNTLSFDSADAGSKFQGKVKSVAVFKEALSDTELQKLTTI